MDDTDFGLIPTEARVEPMQLQRQKRSNHQTSGIRLIYRSIPFFGGNANQLKYEFVLAEVADVEPEPRDQLSSA